MSMDDARHPTTAALATSHIPVRNGHSIWLMETALPELAKLMVIADDSVRDDMHPLPFWPLGIGVAATNSAEILIPA